MCGLVVLCGGSVLMFVCMGVFVEQCCSDSVVSPVL